MWARIARPRCRGGKSKPKGAVERTWRGYGAEPRGHWKDSANLRKLFDELRRDLGIVDLSGWYETSRKKVAEMGAERALANYGGSLVQALIAAYPEFAWDIARFKHLPQNFWAIHSNRRTFFDGYAKKFMVEHPNGWLNVRASDVRKHGGSGILDRHFNGSLSAALVDAYPEVEWNVEKFSRTPRNYWKNPKHVREFFINFARERNIKIPEGMYLVSKEEIAKAGGASVIGNDEVRSLRAALVQAFPEHDWKIWLFNPVPKGFWEDRGNLDAYFAWLSAELGIKELDDWYRVSYEQVVKLRGHALLTKYGGLYGLLREVYPNHHWKAENFVPTAMVKKNQRILLGMVQELFPNEQVFEDYRHPSLKFEESGYGMELDVFLPGLQLAFEYQGQHHYRDHYLFGEHEITRSRDDQKSLACKEAKIDLIEIPYWWNKSRRSLVATIRKMRPELLVDEPLGEAISELEPIAYSTSALEGTARIKAVNHDHTLLCTLPNGVDFVCDAAGFKEFPKSGTVSFHFSGMFVNGRPTNARVKAVHEAASLPSRGDKIPWYVSVGKAKGRVPSCKGCGKAFTDRSETRLAVNASQIPGMDATPYAPTYCFHLDRHCIQLAIKNDEGLLLPPFEGKALVFKEIALQLEQLKSKLQGIDVIVDLEQAR